MVHQKGGTGAAGDPVAGIDVATLRPDAQQVALIGVLLAELGSASAAQFQSADLRLPVLTIAAVPLVSERPDRARRVADCWEHIDTGLRPPRRSRLIRGTNVG